MANKPQQNALTMYGIKNCDTIKKARRWLEDQGVAYHFTTTAPTADRTAVARFHRTTGLGAAAQYSRHHGASWMKRARNACDNADAAIALMLAQPAIVKRPLLDDGNGHALLGFNADAYQQFIAEVAV